MTLLLLVLLSAAPPKTAKLPPSRAVDAPRQTPTSMMPASAEPGGVMGKKSDTTQCSHCHATSSWTDVRFNHERTGFPLTGAHTTVTCKACHVVDFQRPLPRTCVGCHRDAHAGDLGTQCESCHDTSTWRSRIDADAHRRTNFPLVGGHASLPCVECHFEARERRFARATVDCLNCHQQDYTRTLGTALDHVVRGFDTKQCRTCHGAFRFTPALFPTHDDCYRISSGPHLGLGCRDCHSSDQYKGGVGTCTTGNLRCNECHEHLCVAMDKRHAELSAAGYKCVNRKCYECHMGTGAGR
jgi:hypothetical protein